MKRACERTGIRASCLIPIWTGLWQLQERGPNAPGCAIKQKDGELFQVYHGRLRCLLPRIDSRQGMSGLGLEARVQARAGSREADD